MERVQSVETQLPSSQQLSPGKLKKMFASVQSPSTGGITWRHDVSSSSHPRSLIDLHFTLSFILNQLFSNSETVSNNHVHANTRITNKHSNQFLKI